VEGRKVSPALRLNDGKISAHKWEAEYSASARSMALFLRSML